MASASEVRPERILKDLEALWVELGQSDPDKRNAVLRACALTLLVALDENDDAQEASETVAELMHEHPSRAIVLRVDPQPGGALDARVVAQCWMPFGRRQQICCERIEIGAPAERLEEVPRLILGVTVPDLPFVLWCRGARLCGDSRLESLYAVVDKLIVDSAEFRSAAEGLAFVRASSALRLTGDLAWTRLTPWREMVALLFDDPAGELSPASVERVRIAHGGAARPAPAEYLAGWLRYTLPRPAEMIFEPRPREDAAIVELAFEGGGARASVSVEGAFAVLRMHARECRLPFPPRPLSELLREELGILERDAAFEASLR